MSLSREQTYNDAMRSLIDTVGPNFKLFSGDSPVIADNYHQMSTPGKELTLVMLPPELFPCIAMKDTEELPNCYTWYGYTHQDASLQQRSVSLEKIEESRLRNSDTLWSNFKKMPKEQHTEYINYFCPL